jgi:hypothetical protein
LSSLYIYISSIVACGRSLRPRVIYELAFSFNRFVEIRWVRSLAHRIRKPRLSGDIPLQDHHYIDAAKADPALRQAFLSVSGEEHEVDFSTANQTELEKSYDFPWIRNVMFAVWHSRCSRRLLDSGFLRSNLHVAWDGLRSHSGQWIV